MLKRLVFIIAISSALCLSAPAYAGYCAEKVTRVIIRNNEINFTTDHSCPNWCTVNTSWSADTQNRFYTQMLTALVADRPTTFYFSMASSDCAVVPGYSSPELIAVQ